ncbi:hypothetical protein [Paraburkholderia tuberum]|uniref:hypothetical protein n=1 Tax=Paraburkholderia TaxID=1822464 RepID=UPI00115F9893|nr:hypothetical protein [Paraburkholderia tuberum]
MNRYLNVLPRARATSGIGFHGNVQLRRHDCVLTIEIEYWNGRPACVGHIPYRCGQACAERRPDNLSCAASPTAAGENHGEHDAANQICNLARAAVAAQFMRPIARPVH